MGESDEADDSDPVGHAKTEAAASDPFAATGVASSPGGVAAPGIGIGSRFGRYVVVRQLGAGGMGAVYAASDPDLDRLVAIKVLHPDLAEERAMLVREGKAIARLRHPNAITVYDIGESEGVVFIAMEYVEGTTLRAWLDVATRTQSEILAAYVAAGRGLAAAHAVGLVHRDFKPDNVLVGNDGRVVVTDFGLARETHRDGPVGAADPTSLAATQSIIGTPGYMSPEQFRADPIDARSDQFSFCVAIFEALNGKRPFPGANFVELRDAVLGNRLETPTKPAARAIHAALMRGLSHEREARWPVLGDLLEVIAPRVARKRVFAIAAVATLGIVGASIAIALRGGASGDPCVAGTSRLAGIWDDDLRTKLQARFGAVKRIDVDEVLGFVVGDLDGYSRQWSKQWDAACHADDRETEPLLHTQRLTCLENALLDLHGIGDSLASVEPKLFSEGFSGFFNHASLADCTRTAVLRAQLPAPPPDRRAAVTQLFLELQHVRADARKVVNAGGSKAHVDEVLARFDTIAKKLDVLESPMAAVASKFKGYYLRSLAENDLARVPGARAAIAVALRRAEASRNDPEIAEAHVLAARLELELLDPDLTHADAELVLAEAAVARAGHPTRVTYLVDAVKARVAMARGRYDEANALWHVAVPAQLADGAYSTLAMGRFDDDFVEEPVRSLARAGHRDEAIALLRDAVAGEVPFRHTMVAANNHRVVSRLFDWLDDLDSARSAATLAVGVYVDLRAPTMNLAEVQVELAGIGLRRGAKDEVDSSLQELNRLIPAFEGQDPKAESWLLVALTSVAWGQLEVARAAVARATTPPTEGIRDQLAYMFREPPATFNDSDLAVLFQHALLEAQRGSVRVAEELRRDLAKRAPAGDPTIHVVNGAILVELGRWSEARTELELARSTPGMWRRDADLAEIEAGLGRARLETGDVAGARAILEHSLRLLDHATGGFHYFAPMVELSLAKILWDSGEDRVRARAEAERARAGYLRLGPGRDPERREVEAWLAAHPAAARPSP